MADVRSLRGRLKTGAGLEPLIARSAGGAPTGLIDPVTGQDVGGDSLIYNNIGLIGDSRMAQYFSDQTTKRTINAVHFLAQANSTQTLKKSAKVTFHSATSGWRSDQYLTQAVVDAAIASTAGIIIIWGVVNDIAYGTTARQAFYGWSSGAGPVGALNTAIGIKSAALQLARAGKKVVLITEPGQTGMTGSAAKLGEINTYNELIRSLAAQMGRVYVYDIRPVILDPTSAGVAFKGGYVIDGTHLVTAGAIPVGNDFSPWLAKLLDFIKDGRLASAADIAANGSLQFFNNPLFLTTTGGTAGTNTTGNVPANWFVAGSANVAVAVSTAAGEYGNDLVLTLTASAGGSAQVYYYFGSSSVVAGDVWAMGGEVTVDSGSAGFCGVSAKHLIQVDGATYIAEDMYSPSSFAPGPSKEYTQVLETVDLEVPAYTTFNQRYAYFTMTFDRAGSATVNVRCPWMRKRLVA